MLRGHKAVCPTSPEHTMFYVTAHVTETWRVDEYGNFMCSVGTDEVTHEPDTLDIWSCADCGADATFVEVKDGE